MNISSVIEKLRQLQVSSKVLTDLCRAASKLDEANLPGPISKDIENTFFVYVSQALTCALDDLAVSYKGPIFRRFFLDPPPPVGPRIQIEDISRKSKPEKREKMTAGGPTEEEMEDWRKSLWEDLPWEEK